MCDLVLQGLLVAHELRERLRPSWLPRQDAPSSNKILEAITHRSCADSIDFERYELLGDAFLKFTTANHLYATRTESSDEGTLSLELHRRVSNGTLWRCAVVRVAHCLHLLASAATGNNPKLTCAVRTMYDVMLCLVHCVRACFSFAAHCMYTGAPCHSCSALCTAYVTMMFLC